MRGALLRRRRRTLVLGGARSGKSAFAEALLTPARAVTYAACGLAADDADPGWAGRVAEHRARRPAAWQTVETRDLVPLLGTSGPALLIDCLSSWLAGTMDDVEYWSDAPGSAAALAARVDELVLAWSLTPRRVVAVSSEVGLGVIPSTPAGGRFRDELGALNRRAAAGADRVWLVVAGIPRPWK